MNDISYCKPNAAMHETAALLPAFEEIAVVCMKIARRKDGAFKAMQDYLDGSVEIGGACRCRRSVLLAVHDASGKREAPLALQRAVLTRLAVLRMSPAPKVTLCQDIATAILRMEAFLRASPASASPEKRRAPSLPLLPVWEGLRTTLDCRVQALHVALRALSIPTMRRLPALTGILSVHAWPMSLKRSFREPIHFFFGVHFRLAE